METTLKELMEKVRVGKPTCFSLVDELNAEGKPDGKRLVVELMEAPPEEPIRLESPARAHLFADVPGFAQYLLKYATDGLVVLADIAHGKISAVLNEDAKNGREMVLFEPLAHPYWIPWAACLGKKLPVEAFVSLLRNNRRSVAEPDARELLLALSQIEARTEIQAHHGTGKKCLNGLLVKTNVQGQVRDEIVELPDALVLKVPIYVARPAVRVEIDLNIEATQGGDVLVSMASGDIEEAKFTAFEQILSELRGLLKKGTFTYGQPGYSGWTYLQPVTVRSGQGSTYERMQKMYECMQKVPF